MLDVVVVHGTGNNRRVLLVRPEGGPWELPFGTVETGRSVHGAAAGILWNQCGLKTAGLVPVHTWLGDCRACLYLLPVRWPPSPGGPVAEASWWPMPDGIGDRAPGTPPEPGPAVPDLVPVRLGGLFGPHRPVLAAAVAWLDAHGR